MAGPAPSCSHCGLIGCNSEAIDPTMPPISQVLLGFDFQLTLGTPKKQVPKNLMLLNRGQSMDYWTNTHGEGGCVSKKWRHFER